MIKREPIENFRFAHIDKLRLGDVCLVCEELYDSERIPNEMEILCKGTPVKITSIECSSNRTHPNVVQVVDSRGIYWTINNDYDTPQVPLIVLDDEYVDFILNSKKTPVIIDLTALLALTGFVIGSYFHNIKTILFCAAGVFSVLFLLIVAYDLWKNRNPRTIMYPNVVLLCSRSSIDRKALKKFIRDKS